MRQTLQQVQRKQSGATNTPRLVPLTPTELRAWRQWFPDAQIFDVLLMRKRNGGRLHCVMGGAV
ncbi:MAG: hypothetical protein IMF06_05420 [Proteobacteria bacterium]|nr:hypothetical protein [Pseudomonadota bacterium]